MKYYGGFILHAKKEDEIKKKQMTNLEEKIYLLIFGKPRYISEISVKLYKNKEEKYVNTKVIKMHEKHWIEEIPKDGSMQQYEMAESRMENDKVGARKLGRHNYVASNIGPLFDSIYEELQDKNIDLDNIEKDKLKKLLGFELFRDFIFTITEHAASKDEMPDFEVVKKILSIYFNYLLALSNYTYYKFGSSPTSSEEKIELKFNVPHPIFKEDDDIRYLPPEKLIDKMNEVWKIQKGDYDELSLEFMKLGIPLIEKLAQLQLDFKGELLFGFFNSALFFADAANKLDK